MRERTPGEVRRALLLREEIALIDLREEGVFAAAHPLFAACLPLSRIELDAWTRLPRRFVPIVLYDDGEGLVSRAAPVFAALGYTDVSALSGGLSGWRAAGYEVFQDVNSYSKAFGELVETRRLTPSIPAEDLDRLIRDGADMVVLDARRFDEYRTMSIPTGVSVPGAELVARVADHAPRPETLVVVNCAGRTRSIIGAQSLINAGVPNPVAALRNGAIGWTLAGLELDHGQTRRHAFASPERLDEARKAARDVAYRAGVRRISSADVDALAADASRTLYRFDVRTPEEYAIGRLPGFASAPGGQLVQETDMFAPVRGARVVLADDLGPRADMTASWLAQMGVETYVVDGAFEGSLETGPAPRLRPEPPPVPVLTPSGLAARAPEDRPLVVDLGPSPAYRKACVPGAAFAVRARLAEVLPADARAVVLTAADPDLARLGAADLARARPDLDVAALDGGNPAWAAAGLPTEAGADRILGAADDVYRRPYEGKDHAAAAKQAYLDWEFGLVAQLERDGTHGFFVI